MFRESIDCLKAVHGDTYKFLFLFDHSNGHDRNAPDALNSNAICKTFGGKQPTMCDTTILNNTFLGPYNHTTKLKVGDTQQMTFSYTNPGPFYLSEEEQAATRFDKIIGTKMEKYSKYDLFLKLKAKGIKNPKGGTKKIQQLCKSNGVPTS